jgi:hypothetical protein
MKECRNCEEGVVLTKKPSDRCGQRAMVECGSVLLDEKRE